MKEFAAAEAGSQMDALLDMVERGEEVRITRDGRPVARLVRVPAPVQPVRDVDAAREAARQIIENSRGVTLGPGLTLKDLIEEGRR